MRALDDSDPRQIGRFAVLGLLGAGGMGRVYLARPIDGPDHPDAWVAVKVIRPELADDTLFRVRFRREVEAAARVNAMFTAEVVDADPDAPAPWLATRYLPGKTLAEEIADHGPFDTHRLRGLALRLAEVLAAVHATGVVHRDSDGSRSGGHAGHGLRIGTGRRRRRGLGRRCHRSARR